MTSLSRILALSISAIILFAVIPVFATTKGLNQIVTPDIQPVGILSTSVQVQDPMLGNSKQLQLELGLTNRLEVAASRGFSPGETSFGVEYGLVQSKSILVSTGILGIEQGKQAQPFLEAGYYHGKGFGVVGVEQIDSKAHGMFGIGYQQTPTLFMAVDYVTGAEGYAAAGVTLALTQHLSLSPGIYVTNDSSHKAYGYAVLTWNSKLW